jgi:amino acid permease
MSRAEPLLPASEKEPATAKPGLRLVFFACISLVATTVGAGVLSVPISFAYCGSELAGILLLAFFGIISTASLRFIVVAAELMGAPSYLALGERCFGRAGASAVLWSLIGLLGGAFVQLSIIVVDLTEMLLATRVFQTVDYQPSRLLVTVLVLLLAFPLCLQRELLQLSFASSLSVGCILFTCFCIVSLSLSGDGEEEPWEVHTSVHYGSGSGAPGLRSTWPLATPIFALAFCSQFQILEIAHSIPAPQRRQYLPAVTYGAMGAAYGVYALVGLVCYGMLGERALRYPNVLTAFGNVPLVACGSLAIAAVNFLKLPLVLLPLRALLLEHCGVAPPVGRGHGLLTLLMVAAFGVLAMLAGNLAFAFQVSGSTAGVSVCFCLPGLLYAKASRASRLGAAASGGGGGGGGMAISHDEIMGYSMALVGVVSGAVCLWVLISAPATS